MWTEQNRTEQFCLQPHLLKQPLPKNQLWNYEFFKRNDTFFKCTIIKVSCEVKKQCPSCKNVSLQLLWAAAGIKQKPQAPSLFYLGDAARTPTGLNISQNGSGALKEGTTHFISTTQRTRSQIVPNESVNTGLWCAGWCNVLPRTGFSGRTFKQQIAPGGSSPHSPLEGSLLLFWWIN